MKIGRRRLLTATLGAAQMALLTRSGVARALDGGLATTGPTKLLTLFLPGGWMSPFALIPWSASEVDRVLPEPYLESGEPIFCRSSHVKNLDGSTDPGRIRVPALWDAAELSAGRPDRRMGTSPHGWSWVQHRLWENVCVLQGIDNGTVAHAGGQMSAMCGIASSTLKEPTLNAVVADGLYSRFPDRPVPSVWIGGPFPGQLDLRAEVGPARLQSQVHVDLLLSDKADKAWRGLRARDVDGGVAAPLRFDGTVIPNAGYSLNPIEERTLRRMRELKGAVDSSSEEMVERLYQSLLGASRVLARDVATAVQNTRGFERTPVPFWSPRNHHCGLNLGPFQEDPYWLSDFEMALKLLKSDVCSSVALGAVGASHWPFDAGHAEGHAKSWMQARGIFEIIGRLLGEMKATTRGNNRTLLDETLVVVLSDFSRTMPLRSVSSDHWAMNTVIFAGGGLQTNKTVGGYVVPNRPVAQVTGHDNLPVSILEEGRMVTRGPRSADVITTALSLFGITGHRISGGSGEILGVRAA